MLALLCDGSLDVGLGGPGMIYEEIPHLGGISWVLKVSDSFHTHVLKVSEYFMLKTKQVTFFF